MGQRVTKRLLNLKDNLQGVADGFLHRVLRDLACRRN
jgi:hypothetical protein